MLGAVTSRWEEMAATAVADAHKDSDGHTRVYSGEVVWCSTCGAYADKKAHGMKRHMQRSSKERRGRRQTKVWRNVGTATKTNA